MCLRALRTAVGLTLRDLEKATRSSAPGLARSTIQTVEQGERMGIIRFGSRVDVFIPTNSVLRAKLGDITTAGVTVLGELRDQGLSVLLVEQDLRSAFAVADEVAVMRKGEIVHRAPTLEFRSDAALAARLLGV